MVLASVLPRRLFAIYAQKLMGGERLVAFELVVTVDFVDPAVVAYFVGFVELVVAVTVVSFVVLILLAALLDQLQNLDFLNFQNFLIYLDHYICFLLVH